MKLYRSQILQAVCRKITYIGVGIYHNHVYEGLENIPKEGPVLIMAKHQSMKDIPFEGFFLKKVANRQANWIMKTGLVMGLKYLGGIPIKRVGDVRKKLRKIKNIKDPEKQKIQKAKIDKVMKNARKLNEKTMDYTRWLYSQDEIVVLHPEGGRVPYKMGPIRKEMFQFTREAEEEYGIKIPVVPVGLEYESKYRFRSNVYVRAGKPLDIQTPDIANIVENEIRLLSNM